MNTFGISSLTALLFNSTSSANVSVLPRPSNWLEVIPAVYTLKSTRDSADHMCLMPISQHSSRSLTPSCNCIVKAESPLLLFEFKHLKSWLNKCHETYKPVSVFRIVPVALECISALCLLVKPNVVMFSYILLLYIINEH